MRRSAAFLFLALALVLPFASAFGGASVRASTDRIRYVTGEQVRITIENRTSKRVTVESLRIKERATRKTVARVEIGAQGTIAPDAQRTFVWDPQNESGPVDAGRYLAVAETDAGTAGTGFSIGQFFTLGFDGRDVTFRVYVTAQPEIDEMTAEAERSEKNLIVSGIVRARSLRYNPDWSYIMGPASIVLGEVFTEVCDASPGYVERHKKQWAGERWCPWSSYVASVGR